MRDRKLSKTIISPEAPRARLPYHILHLPRCFESSSDNFLIGSNGVPETGNAAGTSQVGDGKLLEDEAEDVAAGEGEEVRVHWRQYGSGGSSRRRLRWRRRNGRRGIEVPQDIDVVVLIATASHFRERGTEMNGWWLFFWILFEKIKMG